MADIPALDLVERLNSAATFIRSARVPIVGLLGEEELRHTLAVADAAAEISRLRSELEKARERDTGVPEDIPTGAIENGRELLRRLVDNYRFESEAGPLRNCSEFQDVIRCFEALAEWIGDAAPQPHAEVPA